ncbi:monovalent cation/H+ antiporter complex subunit F [Paeniglutamicibacter antarcticus]|uniref:Cation:proton antiporter n=1 Tax=Paeniglutamicibacter antarcticus TaxID=494023 RepID=A0ABP9TRB5_9MICC
MNIVLWVCGITLSIAGALTIIRLAKGPSILERVIATDVLLLILSAALCIEMTVNKHTDNLIFVLLACLVGFVGSVTVSRFVTDRRNA